MKESGPKYAPDVSCYEPAAFHPLRIESITEQLRLLSYYDCDNVLEIGLGKGLIRHFLKCFQNIKYTSIDIAASLNPDFVGSVLDMPFGNAEFDCVLCCQVLEHLPLSDFPAALGEIRRVSRRLVIISLPDKRRRLGVGVCLFRFGWHKFEWNLERTAAWRTRIATRHYWEIGHSAATKGKNIRKTIEAAGFRIRKTYRLERHQWHSLFVLDR